MSSSDDELRPVTALFADLVGSTALGERLSPGEVKALVGECVTRMSSAVEEYGGVVQAYMGDGVCAYFGVPTAHEDDPERAARAALRIVEAVGGTREMLLRPGGSRASTFVPRRPRCPHRAARSGSPASGGTSR